MVSVPDRAASRYTLYAAEPDGVMHAGAAALGMPEDQCQPAAAR